MQGGLRHGKGAITYADGATYDGQWFQDLRHGMGQYRYYLTRCIYDLVLESQVTSKIVNLLLTCTD